MEISPRLSLSYLAPSQAQKHVTVNETFRRLDQLVQTTVLSRTTSAEPGAPADGDAYILPASPTGTAWSGYSAGNIAAWQDGAWIEIAAFEGARAFVADTDEFVIHDGSTWNVYSNESAAKFGVNATADTTNRLTVKSDAALFSHDDVTPGSGDMRVFVNKDAAGDTASHIFQTNSSGRAEFGLTGDDDFHIKVSPDNFSTVYEAIVIDKDTGFSGFNQTAPQDRIHVTDTDAALRLEDTANSYLQIKDEQAVQAKISKYSASGISLIDFNPLPADGTSNGSFRFFRETNTTGNVYFDIHLGNNTSGVNARIGASGADTYFCSNNGSFGIGTNSPGALLAVVGGGVMVGSPTGGDKGAGAINAQAVYDDNALLSCYVFDQAIDGSIDMARWDGAVPDRVIPATYEDREDEKTKASIRVKVEDEIVVKRTHDPARLFSGRIGGDYDPLTLDGYARHWKEKRHLTSMPNEAAFDPLRGLSSGEWIQRLVETVEIQAVLIEELNQRTKNVTPA